MNWKEENFITLTAEYRKKGAALKGYRNLAKERDSVKKKKLRNHKVKAITTDEDVLYRDQVDELIQFYSLLEIALLAGYIPFQFSYEDKKRVQFLNELKLILDDKYVRKYYEEFYPLLLPQLIYKHSLHPYLNMVPETEADSLSDSKPELSAELKPYRRLVIPPSEKGSNTNTSNKALEDLLTKWSPLRPYLAIFPKTDEKDQQLLVRFLSLEASIKNNDDIDTFLWFLDDGIIDGYAIPDVLKLLGSPKDIKLSLESHQTEWDSDGLKGFMKYCHYLVAYKNLLDSSKDKPILQSAFWHYQSYWFIRMKTKMRGRLLKGLKNLADVVNKRNEESFNNDYNSQKGQGSKTKISFREWRTESQNKLKEIEQVVRALLNPEYGTPLKEFYKQVQKVNGVKRFR